MLETGRIRVNDTELSYTEEGSGEAIVFLHGSLGTLSTFGDVRGRFSPTHRTVTYSRRFHPPSTCDDPRGVYDIHLHAADLSGLIRALELAPAHVVGASYGAYVALVLSLQEPGLMKSIVACEPPMLPLLRASPAGRRMLEEFLSGALEPSREAFRTGDAREGVARFMDGILGRRGAFASLSPHVQRQFLEAAPSLRLEFLTPFDLYMPEVTPEELRRIRLPVLLMGGERSPRMFHTILDELERHLPRCRRVLIRRSGHSMHTANPPAFESAVRAFLAEQHP